MVKRIIKTVKGVLFADPELIFENEKDLINKSFYFKGNNGKGVILIHGWTSTPYEVRRLGKYLNERGFTVSGPMLRGHGTKPEDIEHVTYKDWMEDLTAEIDKMKNECGSIYIGGTSIGANLAMLLGIERPDLKGLVLMAPPYKIKFENLLEILGKMLIPFKRFNNKYYPPTFGVSTTITRIISYQKYSIKSSLETLELVKASRQRLAEIKQPVFLIMSLHDHIIARNSLEQIYNRVSSAIKRKKYIKRAYHTFISDIKNENVFEEIADFLEEN